MSKPYPPLLDAAGNEVATDTCGCGRPKAAALAYCCAGCWANPNGTQMNHSSACNMRCATLGVPGFGVSAVQDRYVAGESIRFHRK